MSSGIDEPARLADLLEPADIEEIADGFAKLHGFAAGVYDPDGTLIARAGPGAAGQSAVAASGAARGVHTGPDERRYYLAPLVHDGESLGLIVLGPYGERRSENEVVLVTEQLARVIGVVIHNSLARHLTSTMHVAAMEEAFTELQAKSERLEKAVERLQEVDRLKSSFLATMSHELRTPLTSVIGYSEMLLEGLAGPINDEQRDYLQTILAKADQLLHLITGILDASLLESGTTRLEPKPFALPDVVEGVVATFAPEAAKRRIHVAVSRREVPRALGDGRKIRQVLWNLIANAIKFTPHGGEVAIDYEVGPLAPDGLVPSRGPDGAGDGETSYGLRVIVRDNGIGISAEKQAHIFEPFFQVDSSSTREYGGTGLGLTLAKRYVEAHGGRIWVSSKLGQGATFTVSLPVVPDELDRYVGRTTTTPTTG